MRITKDMVSKARKMKHGEQIVQHYKLYKFYLNKDNTKAAQNKSAFLQLAGFSKRY